MSYVLVLNSGSSSVKFQIVDSESQPTDDPFASGVVEQIGEPSGSITIKANGEKHQVEEEIPDHTAGLRRAFELLDANDAGPNRVDIVAVGHRVVHGGTVFSKPALIDDDTIATIKELIPLAPLHNPANLAGIEVARELFPDLPHVAVFDTAFFAELPEEAATYAIDRDVAKDNGVRRYGFHGTSHEFIAAAVSKLVDKPDSELRQIILHLGNGASASAVKGGKPVDTTMGLTPLEGLVMGTRSGDIDPGIIFHLSRQGGMSIDEIDTLLNKRSGIKGISGVNDFRDLHKLRDEGDDNAQLAYDVYIHRLRRYIGAYLVALGGVDVITFTAGVGENDERVRADALAGLEEFGIIIDEERNNTRGGARVISTDDSRVTVLVAPTNEELSIARYAANFA